MIRHLLRRLLGRVQLSLDSGRAWDATAASPELVARLGNFKEPERWVPCEHCGTFIRGAHACPVIFQAEPHVVVPITRRKRSA